MVESCEWVTGMGVCLGSLCKSVVVPFTTRPLLTCFLYFQVLSVLLLKHIFLICSRAALTRPLSPPELLLVKQQHHQQPPENRLKEGS